MNETEKLRKRTSTKYERAKAERLHPSASQSRAGLWARPGTHMRRPRHSRSGRVPAQMWASVPSPNPEGSVSNAAGPCYPVVRYATVAAGAPACKCEPSERDAQPQSAQATRFHSGIMALRTNGVARRHESRRAVLRAANRLQVVMLNAPQWSRMFSCSQPMRSETAVMNVVPNIRK